MGWRTTADLEEFLAAAGGYLRTQAAENSLLLSAAQAARTAPQPAGTDTSAEGLLFGWWEPPDGGGPRAAFVHDPGAPLLIAGRAPEMAAALAPTLAKLARPVYGVDAPTEAADAFAAAWTQRAGVAARVHRHRLVYRLPAPGQPGRPAPVRGGPAASPGVTGPGMTGPGWPPAEMPGPSGRLRVATTADQPLLASWLSAFAGETAERLGAPGELAAELIGYGGAVLWEVPQRPGRLRDAAHHLPVPHLPVPHLPVPHRRSVPPGGAPSGPPDPAEPALAPAALVTLDRPVAGTVRMSIVYTPPEQRHRGYAVAGMLAVSRAVLVSGAPGGVRGGTLMRSRVDEVVMITDGNRSGRSLAMLGFQLAGERTVLRFGAVTGPLPRLGGQTGSSPRLPTGPLPRLPRLRR